MNEPIFVIGSYRSGTSIFAWCLGQHPNIVNLPETNWLSRLTLNVDEFFHLGTVNGKYSHLGQLGLSADEFVAGFGVHVDNYIKSLNPALVDRTESGAKNGNQELRRRRSEVDPKNRWVDATPENSHYVYGLSRLFKGARFIHLLRNPVDVARSLTQFSKVGARDYETEEAFQVWHRLVTAAVRAEQAFGRDTVLRVEYEKLVSDPETTMRACTEFLGETYSADCIKPLVTRINSSETESADRALSLTGMHARKALAYYDAITVPGQGPGSPDSAEYELLAKDHSRYVAALRNPLRTAAGRVRRQLRVFWQLIRRLLPGS